MKYQIVELKRRDLRVSIYKAKPNLNLGDYYSFIDK